MNRQARLHNPNEPHIWKGYGDISILEAARRRAVEIAVDQGGAPIDLNIEARCETSPEIPAAVFNVRVDLVATVLNPRLDTDSKES